MKVKFQEKIQDFEETITHLKTEIKIASQGVGNDDPYLKMFLKHKNITKLNRGILVELIDTIYVHENNEITINFNFTDQHKRMLEFIENNW